MFLNNVLSSCFPNFVYQSNLQVSGYGLALASVSLEQDAGYWEIHVVKVPDEIGRIYVGVSPKRDRQFFADGVKSEGFWTNSDEAKDSSNGDDGDGGDDDPHPAGTELMKRLAVTANDVIGIAMQQSDLPMLQFTLNGAPLTDGSINRFRGNPYPAIYLPDDNSGSVRFVFRDCQHSPPNSRFVPIMEARGLV
jgi:hypothetical protein